jgi:AraC-like DNA-binding protein
MNGQFADGIVAVLSLLVVASLTDARMRNPMHRPREQSQFMDNLDPSQRTERGSAVQKTEILTHSDHAIRAPGSPDNALFANQRAVAIPRLVLLSALASRTRNGILPTDVGHYVEAWGHYCRRPAGVDRDTFVYCTAGHGWCRVGGQELTICPGELLVIPADVPHAYGADAKTPWSVYWFLAEGVLNADCSAAMGVDVGNPVIAVGHDSKLISLFVELIDVLEEGHDPEHLLHGSSIVAHLLSLIIRCQRQATRLVPNAAQRVSASIEFMQRNLAHALDIAQLSRMAKLSPSYYSALFKRQTGRSPLDYFLQLRMQRAAELVDATNQSVKAIAARLGYADALYFTRVFTGVHGMSPTDYRRRQQSA